MALEDFSKSVHIDTGNKAILTVNWEKTSKNLVYTFWLIGSEAIFTPTHHTAHLLAKREQRSFCTAQILASFGVKLAYGVISAGNLVKEKPEISRIIKKFQAYIGKLLLNRLHRGDVARFGSVFVQQNPTASTKSGDFGGNNPTSSNTVHESCTRFWSRPHFRGF